jgi:hypothetical protein
MASLDLTPAEKLSVLKASYQGVLMNFCSSCYTVGIDPFTVDLENFTPSAELNEMTSGHVQRMAGSLLLIKQQIAEAEAAL